MTYTDAPAGYKGPDPTFVITDEWLALVEPEIESVPDEVESLRHLPGQHDQKSHGGGGGPRESSATTMAELRKDMAYPAYGGGDSEVAHPERYAPNAKYGQHLKDGEREQRIRRGEDGKPEVFDVTAKPYREIADFENVKGYGMAGVGSWVVEVEGSSRRPTHVYRAVSEADWQRMKGAGVLNSDGRMNLADYEGMVTHKGDPSFYLPREGEGRILRIQYDDRDGWFMDGADSYIKTTKDVPLSRVDLVSPPISNGQIVADSRRHLPGQHDQKSHGHSQGGGSGKQTAKSDMREAILATALGAAGSALASRLLGKDDDEVADELRDEDLRMDVKRRVEVNLYDDVSRTMTDDEILGMAERDGFGNEPFDGAANIRRMNGEPEQTKGGEAEILEVGPRSLNEWQAYDVWDHDYGDDYPATATAEAQNRDMRAQGNPTRFYAKGTPEAKRALAERALSQVTVGEWAWGRTAAPANQAFQNVIAKTFGIDKAWSPAQAAADYKGTVEFQTRHGSVLSAAAKSMYDRTQASLARATEGRDRATVTLYRGMRTDRPVAAGDRVILKPASSFSLSSATAEAFGTRWSDGYVMSVEVPIERIFSTPATGAGCLGEQEFIVLGPDVRPFAVSKSTDQRSILPWTLEQYEHLADEDEENARWIDEAAKAAGATPDSLLGLDAEPGMPEGRADRLLLLTLALAGNEIARARVVDGVRRHLQGQHNQKSHGRKGAGGEGEGFQAKSAEDFAKSVNGPSGVAGRDLGGYDDFDYSAARDQRIEDSEGKRIKALREEAGGDEQYSGGTSQQLKADLAFVTRDDMRSVSDEEIDALAVDLRGYPAANPAPGMPLGSGTEAHPILISGGRAGTLRAVSEVALKEGVFVDGRTFDPKKDGDFDSWVADGSRRGVLAIKYSTEDKPRHIDALEVGPKSAMESKRYVVASLLTHTWASTSNDENEISLGLQEAVRANFGIKFNEDSDGNFNTSKGGGFYTKHKNAYDTYVQATYKRTQSQLANSTMIDTSGTVKVYRSMTVSEDVVAGTKFTGTLRPLSAFAYDRQQQFGDEPEPGQVRVHIEAEVPVSQVFSTSTSGPGCFAENEIVVIGPDVAAYILDTEIGSPDPYDQVNNLFNGGEPLTIGIG